LFIAPRSGSLIQFNGNAFGKMNEITTIHPVRAGKYWYLFGVN